MSVLKIEKKSDYILFLMKSTQCLLILNCSMFNTHPKRVLGLESQRQAQLQRSHHWYDTRKQQDLGQTGWNRSNCLEQWLNFLKSELGFFSDSDTPDYKRCKRSHHPACAGVFLTLSLSFARSLARLLSPFVLMKEFIGGEWVNNTAELGVVVGVVLCFRPL